MARSGSAAARQSWKLGRRQSRPVTVYVTAPALQGAAIGGSGDMRIDKVESPRFAASIGGSGDIEIAALRVERGELLDRRLGRHRAAGAAPGARAS